MPGLELTNDYLILDGLETTTITDAGGATVVPNSYKHVESQVENSPSEGVYQATHVIWDFPAAIAQPEIGGTVTATDGTVYTILEITHEPFLGNYWGVRTKKLELNDEFALVDTLTLWRKVTTTDSFGSRLTTHPSASVSDIRAKIQQMPSPIEDRVGKRGFVRQYEIFIDLFIPDGWTSIDDLLKDEGLIIYTIKSWKNRERIDEFSVLVCERTLT